MNQEDRSPDSTRRLARLLMESAKQDPSLVGRSRSAATEPRLDRHLLNFEPQFPLPVALPAHHTLGIELEELASAAMASAQHAEDAFRQAQEASRTARRSMAVFASIGVLGILVGLGGIIDNHLRGGAGIVRSEASAANPATPAAVPARPVTDPSPAPPVEIVQTASVAATGAAAASPSSRAGMQPVTPPVYHGPVAYAPPWQADVRPVRRVGIGPQRASYGPPQFVAAFRRDLRSLFRGLAR